MHNLCTTPVVTFVFPSAPQLVLGPARIALYSRRNILGSACLSLINPRLHFQFLHPPANFPRLPRISSSVPRTSRAYSARDTFCCSSASVSKSEQAGQGLLFPLFAPTWCLEQPLRGLIGFRYITSPMVLLNISPLVYFGIILVSLLVSCEIIIGLH